MWWVCRRSWRTLAPRPPVVPVRRKGAGAMVYIVILGATESVLVLQDDRF